MLTERRRDGEGERGSDRSYGLVFAAVFAIVGLWPLTGEGGEVRIWALAVAAGLALVAWLRPVLLAPVNRLWFRFGLLLHKTISPLVMGLVFFVAVTPLGLLRSLFVRDPLGLRLDPTAETYWVEKETKRPPKGSMERQF